jgi:hypothetical protein
MESPLKYPTFDITVPYFLLCLLIAIFALYLIGKLLFINTNIQGDYGMVFPAVLVVFAAAGIIFYVLTFEVYFRKMDEYNNYMDLRKLAVAKLNTEREQKIEELIKTF